jgi:uncharacterized membrane protein (Fun14 family)
MFLLQISSVDNQNPISGREGGLYDINGLVAGVGLEKSGTYVILKIGVYLLNTIFLRFRVCN